MADFQLQKLCSHRSVFLLTVPTFRLFLLFKTTGKGGLFLHQLFETLVIVFFISQENGGGGV